MIEKNGVKVKQFYGMSSATAMQKHAGGVAEYRYVVLVLFIWYLQGVFFYWSYPEKF